MSAKPLTAVKAVSELKNAFRVNAERNMRLVEKENNRFLGHLPGALFVVLTAPFSDPYMGLRNNYSAAANELEKVEEHLSKGPTHKPDAVAGLNALKAQFDKEAADVREWYPVNLYKRHKRAQEFRGYSKKVDAILGML